MPFQDVIQAHFTAAEVTTLQGLFDQIDTILLPKLRNLSEAENVQYGFINETNKLFVNKVEQYHLLNPALSSPDVDWVEFMADYGDRSVLEGIAIRMESLAKSCKETKRLHDYDNFQNALLDYRYTKYKNTTEPGAGYDTKEEELKQFFPNTGGGNDDTPPTT